MNLSDGGQLAVERGVLAVLLAVENDRRVGADSVPELLYPEEDVSEGGVVRE